MSTFKQKKVYHSYLKQASPLVMQFRSQPLESKYQEGQWVMYFGVRGDSTDGYYLLLENDSIRETLQNAVGQGWTKVEASGSGDDAEVRLSQPENVASEASGGPSNGRTASALYTSIPEAYAACLDAAEMAVSEWLDRTTLGKSNDTIRLQLAKDVATTFFINMSGTSSIPLDPEVVQEAEPETVTEPVTDTLTEEHVGILREYYDAVDWNTDKTHDGRDVDEVSEHIYNFIENGIEENGTFTIMRNMMGWMDKQMAFQKIHKSLPLESGAKEDDLPF